MRLKHFPIFLYHTSTRCRNDSPGMPLTTYFDSLHAFRLVLVMINLSFWKRGKSGEWGGWSSPAMFSRFQTDAQLNQSHHFSGISKFSVIILQTLSFFHVHVTCNHSSGRLPYTHNVDFNAACWRPPASIIVCLLLVHFFEAFWTWELTKSPPTNASDHRPYPTMLTKSCLLKASRFWNDLSLLVPLLNLLCFSKTPVYFTPLWRRFPKLDQKISGLFVGQCSPVDFQYW